MFCLTVLQGPTTLEPRISNRTCLHELSELKYLGLDIKEELAPGDLEESLGSSSSLASRASSLSCSFKTIFAKPHGRFFTFEGTKSTIKNAATSLKTQTKRNSYRTLSC